MDISLKNKKAIVCGATAGIGKAVALELAGLGAEITAVSRNEEKLQKLIKELNQISQSGHNYLVADFEDPATLNAALGENNGKADILVNNTGGPPPGPAHMAEVEEYLKAFQQHLICNQILVKHFLEGLKESGSGRIINIISTSVKSPLDNLGVSNTVRGAVAQWAKTLANELGPFGITVNNVLPGATETGRLQSIIARKAAKTGNTLDESADEMKGSIPLKRFAKPEELAAAVAFLAGPSGAYISGINLPVDGGRTSCL